jgi:hypothetical protein
MDSRLAVGLCIHFCDDEVLTRSRAPLLERPPAPKAGEHYDSLQWIPAGSRRLLFFCKAQRRIAETARLSAHLNRVM